MTGRCGNNGGNVSSLPPSPLAGEGRGEGGFAPGCSHAIIPACSLLSFPTFLTPSFPTFLMLSFPTLLIGNPMPG